MTTQPTADQSATFAGGSAADALRATRRVADQRWQVAALLTTAMVTVYFGFIALVAFEPGWLATRLSDGLSLGIVLGALVIASAWLLTYAYVSWANRVYDPALEALRQAHAPNGPPTEVGQ